LCTFIVVPPLDTLADGVALGCGVSTSVVGEEQAARTNAIAIGGSGVFTVPLLEAE
jgi:hypothetical protein